MHIPSLDQMMEFRTHNYTQALDFELEIAVVIGKAGINIKAEDAHHIFGYTIFND
jgi:2-keto-4-pentenoate hydratase/2-oxohepta-3-ene-1,7-dioic acid hydratase in catechol pathway